MLLNAPDTRFLDWSVKNSQDHLKKLIETLPWQQFKKTNRFVCSLGADYGYSSHVTKGYDFNLYPSLYYLMQRLNKELGTNFNSVLLNYYPKGTYVGIGRHSDNEQDLVPGVVASVSLGQTVEFILETWNKKEHKSVQLKDADVFIMGKNCQQYYVHSIPYTKMIEDRISLTFRQFK